MENSRIVSFNISTEVGLVNWILSVLRPPPQVFLMLEYLGNSSYLSGENPTRIPDPKGSKF